MQQSSRRLASQNHHSQQCASVSSKVGRGIFHMKPNHLQLGLKRSPAGRQEELGHRMAMPAKTKVQPDSAWRADVAGRLVSGGTQQMGEMEVVSQAVLEASEESAESAAKQQQQQRQQLQSASSSPTLRGPTAYGAASRKDQAAAHRSGLHEAYVRRSGVKLPKCAGLPGTPPPLVVADQPRERGGLLPRRFGADYVQSRAHMAGWSEGFPLAASQAEEGGGHLEPSAYGDQPQGSRAAAAARLVGRALGDRDASGLLGVLGTGDFGAPVRRAGICVVGHRRQLSDSPQSRVDDSDPQTSRRSASKRSVKPSRSWRKEWCVPSWMWSPSVARASVAPFRREATAIVFRGGSVVLGCAAGA